MSNNLKEGKEPEFKDFQLFDLSCRDPDIMPMMAKLIKALKSTATNSPLKREVQHFLFLSDWQKPGVQTYILYICTQKQQTFCGVDGRISVHLQALPAVEGEVPGA